MALRVTLISLLLQGLTSFLFTAEHTRYSINPELFPIPKNLEKNIDFWIAVFSQYAQEQAILHDTNDLSVIYEIIDFQKCGGDTADSPKLRQKKLKQTREKYRKILKKLSNLKPENIYTLNAVERRVYALFGNPPNPGRFRIAIRNMRVQFGLREGYLAGLIRSGKYIDEIVRIFKKHGLPEELTRLPHVESSFQYKIYSRVGAAGMWQFTRRTGRRFLKIDYSVDQRIDPFYATEAAAQLLKANFQELGTWPLAITAYNHGVNGMARAKKVVGSNDFAMILEKYHSRSFKFASKNFYAEFIAAVHVRANYKKLFGEVIFSKPIDYIVFKVPAKIHFNKLAQKLELAQETLVKLNPSIRRPVLKAQRKIPENFELRVPVRKGLALADLYTMFGMPEAQKDDLTALPDKQLFQPAKEEPSIFISKNNSPSNQAHAKKSQPKRADFKPFESKNSAAKAQNLFTEFYNIDIPQSDAIIVRPDETLGHLADWLEIPTQKLRRINKLAYGKEIYIGQKLKLSFSNMDRAGFHLRRFEFHKSLEEDFYEFFTVTGVRIHEIQYGENIWTLCSETFEIPFWLLLKYNAHLELQCLKPGDEVIFPLISSIAEKTTGISVSGSDG